MMKVVEGTHRIDGVRIVVLERCSSQTDAQHGQDQTQHRGAPEHRAADCESSRMDARTHADVRRTRPHAHARRAASARERSSLRSD
eukprot:COSAG02_NODE_2964_length_7645_cov_4.848927_5_plen_86_part_00